MIRIFMTVLTWAIFLIVCAPLLRADEEVVAPDSPASDAPVESVPIFDDSP